MKYLYSLLLTVSLNVIHAQKFEQLALTPPMGWNSWNKFACDINEKIIRDAADAFVSNGMKDAGYQYIVIDDCWQIARDKQGFIIADSSKFPSGIKALADYIHSRELKFGIYSCAGRKTCQDRPGSRGHEYQDAWTYANWGVDYLKLDWCNADGQQAKESYTLMRDALFAAGHPIVFSLCEWGSSKPWEWAAPVGHMWRTCGDITPTWEIAYGQQGKIWGGGVVVNLEMQNGLEKFAGPGHWNDPDMLEVGNEGLTENESRAHFSLWCMLAAPLIAGNDLSHMDARTKSILTDKDLIAIDQDALGKQGYRIKDYGQFEIYYKPLQNGDIALCLFNRFDKPIKVDMDWKTLETVLTMDTHKLNLRQEISTPLPFTADAYSVTNCWTKKSGSNTKSNLITEIGAHDVVVLRLTQH